MNNLSDDIVVSCPLEMIHKEFHVQKKKKNSHAIRNLSHIGQPFADKDTGAGTNFFSFSFQVKNQPEIE